MSRHVKPPRKNRLASTKAAKEQITAEAQTPRVKKKVRGKPFVKGDPRIHRGGQITAFHELRKLAQDKLNDSYTDPLHPERGEMSRAEHLILDLIESRREEAKIKVLELGYGKVPDEVHQYNFDMEKLMGKVDMTKLSNEQLAELASGKNIVEVLLGQYL